jgi:hypothetical protein
MIFFRNIKYLSLIFIFLCQSQVFAQGNPGASFYKHLTGTLDTNMQITFDLLAKNGAVTGFYYYYFPEPGNEHIVHFGKTIPLVGEVAEGQIVLDDFGNTGSRFTGKLEQEKTIEGTWIQNNTAKPIPFKITEDYSNGSIPLVCYTFQDVHPLKERRADETKPPEAKMDIILLYPDLPKGNPLRDTFDVILTEFLLNEKISLSSPEVLLEDLSFDFFTSYKNATEGIQDLSSTATFNWEKKVSMDVSYNENNLLSMKIMKYAYTGGAHGIEFTEHVVMDTDENRKIKLEDIFKPGFDKELDELLNNKLRKINGIKENENLKEAGFFVERIAYNDNFYVNNDGIGFYYNLYSIAAYSAGTNDLFLTYQEIRHLLNEDHPFIWGLRE